MKCLIRFDRIGRNHIVPPLLVDLDANDPRLADTVAKAVYRYAFPKLASNDVDVTVDLTKGEGGITCGMQNGGTFHVEEIVGETMDGRAITTAVIL